jgi:glycosyltransferase involved in cell wall biosynthesis
VTLVDILMPVRNIEPYLAEAIGSILAQTFTGWRLIAVDDRSADGTWGALCTWGKRDNRILPLKNVGSGLVCALNTALSHSLAPFVARMDGDDISEPTRMEKLLRLLNREPGASIAGSRVATFPEESVSQNMRRYIRWQNSLLTPSQIRHERYVESTLTHATAMFRQGALLEAGGWREGPFPEDLDLWLRLHRRGLTFVKHPDTLYRWREHERRETRRSARCTPEAFHRCRVMHLAEELKGRGLSRLVVLGPSQARTRWTRSLGERGFDVIPFPWVPGESFPDRTVGADFILAVFGAPTVRAKAREDLNRLGPEDRRWLFAG